ncbi:MAG TPA: cytochrome c oxidase assembly factor Coa1 family protein [Myxococcales bacterium]
MKTVLTVLATFVISGIVVTAIVLFLGLDWGADKAQKEAQSAAASAMQAMSFTQEMHERLGTPFKQGEVTVQNYDIQFMGTSTLQLAVMVSGPKGGGKLSANLSKPRSEKIWYLTNGTFFPTNGPPISIKGRAAPGAGMEGAGGGAMGGALPGF